MPGPWSALKAIPWATILRRTAVVLAAADALRASSRQQRATMATSDLESLRQRIEGLEKQQHANAELVKQLADQTRAIAVGAQTTAAKTRQAFVLVIGALTLAVVALLVAWLRAG